MARHRANPWNTAFDPVLYLNMHILRDGRVGALEMPWIDASAVLSPRWMTTERKMVPREHGAYAELLFPMVTVFLAGSPTMATVLLAIGGIAAFLANEPLLVLVGERGTRLQRTESDRAKRALLVFSLFAVGAGVAGFLMAPRPARLAVILPMLLGGGLFLIAVQRLERSAFGEGLAAAALSSTAVPLGLSAALSIKESLSVTFIWAVVALLGTSIVRLTVARTKAKTDADKASVAFKRTLLIVACLVVIAVGCAAPFGQRVGLWVSAAAVPVAVVVLVMTVARPTARSLRLMGWSLVGASLVSLIAVVSTLRVVRDMSSVEPTLPFPMF